MKFGVINSKKSLENKRHFENRPKDMGTVYARIRRLSDRVNFLEAQASTLRRDLNRVEKRQYGNLNLQKQVVQQPQQKVATVFDECPVGGNDGH